MEQTKKGRPRGKSARTIIVHREIRKLYRELYAAKGEDAKEFRIQYWANQIADSSGYSPHTVKRILNDYKEEKQS